jgi:hypothetical protein
MNHLLDNLGWIPAQDAADAHPAAFAAYVHGRTQCWMLLFWRVNKIGQKGAEQEYWWEFRRKPFGPLEARLDGRSDPETVRRWGDEVLARLSLTDPTLSAPADEG